jgi:hypothetical protein
MPFLLIWFSITALRRLGESTALCNDRVARRQNQAGPGRGRGRRRTRLQLLGAELTGAKLQLGAQVLSPQPPFSVSGVLVGLVAGVSEDQLPQLVHLLSDHAVAH